MSRIAKNPIPLPRDVQAKLIEGKISVSGSKGTLIAAISPAVQVRVEEGIITVANHRGDRKIESLSGTTRATIANMVKGVTDGFERRLTLVGVGYRAQAKGNVLNLSLGYSHPIDFQIPVDISIETPSQTEIVVKGCDKQRVGQIAANIRSYRPPEPYKGKGVKYSDEEIVRKEAKKK